MVGMLNHLYFRGKVDRTLDVDGVFRYLATDTNNGRWNKLTRRKTNLRWKRLVPRRRRIFHPISIMRSNSSKRTGGRCTSEEAGSDSVHSSIPSRLKRLVVLILVALLIGLLYWNNAQIKQVAKQLASSYINTQTVKANERVAQPSLVPVETVQVMNQTQAEVPRQFTGIVKPRRASELGFNRIGVVDEILVERGDELTAGTVLARLNTNMLEANLKAIQAQYRAAEAKLAELLAGPRTQTIEGARAQVAAAQAERDLAQVSLDRALRLVTAGAVSRQELDNAKTNAAAKQEALNVVQNALDELLAGTRSEQILAQRAQLSELEAAQEQLQVQLNESVLKAPFDAVVSDRFIEKGAVAAPGSVAFRLIESKFARSLDWNTTGISSKRS